MLQQCKRIGEGSRQQNGDQNRQDLNPRQSKNQLSLGRACVHDINSRHISYSLGNQEMTRNGFGNLHQMN
jgi:hypothetical protein